MGVRESRCQKQKREHKRSDTKPTSSIQSLQTFQVVMKHLVPSLLLSTALPCSKAWIIGSPGCSRSKTTIIAASKPSKDRVYVDPTASWASDLNQLEQLEKNLAKEKTGQTSEDLLRELRHRHHESRKNMNEAQMESTLQDQKAKENEARLREIRHRHYKNRKHMEKNGGTKNNDYVYVDPTVAWASDLADLQALEAQEKETLLRDLRHRHHENRKNME